MIFNLVATVQKVLSIMRFSAFESSSLEGRSKERYRRVMLTSFSAIFSRGIGMATALISVPLTVHYLGAERYGLWMTISSVIALFGFADLGMGNGLLNAISEANGRDDHEAARKSASSAFFMLLGIAIILLTAFAMVYQFIPWPGVFNVVSDIAIKESGEAMAVFIIFTAINMPLGVVQRIYTGYQEGFVPNLWGIGGNLIGLGGLLLAIYLKAGLPWLVLAMSGGTTLAIFLNGIVLFGWSRPWLLPRCSRFNWSEGRKLAGTGVAFLILQVFTMIAFSSDNLVVAQIMGASMVTSLAITQKLFSITMITQYFIGPLWPAFGEAMTRKDFAWARRTLNRALILSLSASIAMVLPLIVFGKQIITWWVGPTVAPSIMLLAGFGGLVILTSYVGVMSVFFNSGFLVTKQIWFYGAAAVAAVILKIILVYHWQIAGVIWATVLGFAIFYVIPAARLAYKNLPTGESFDGWFNSRILGRFAPMYAFIKRFGSLAKKLCLAYRGAFYTYKEKNNTPIKLDYQKGQLSVRLYPKGQITKPLYTNQYEQSEIKLVIDFLKPGMNILDIGANIGLYSVIADRIVSPSGTIWAFEPSTENFDRLIANLSLNKVLKVNPVQLALADMEDEMIVLQRDRGFGDGERYLALQQGPKYTRDTTVNDNGDAERVRVTTLDNFLYKEIKTPVKIDFIKMDIEGGELRAFRGASRTLANNPDMMIFFECAPLCCQRAGNTTDEVFQYLRTLGFEIYAMNKSNRKWESNQELLSAIGNVWACRHKEMLPILS